MQENTITIYNGDQWRPFIHVSDVAQSLIDVLLAPLEAVSGEIFNVGDDRLNFTLGQIAEKIKKQLPLTRVEHVENADRRNYRVSFSKIRECVGFEARLTVEDGILEVKRAFETGLISNYRRSSYNNLAFLKEKGSVVVEDLDVKVMAAYASAGSRSAHSAAIARNSNRLPVQTPDVAAMRMAEDMGGVSSGA